MKLSVLMMYYENLCKVKLKISKVFLFIFVTLIKGKIKKIFEKIRNRSLILKF